MKSYLLFFFVSACYIATAADTNVVYPIDDGMLVAQNAKGEIKLNRMKFEAAKKMKECLPASENPEGNWGVITGGFQLSLTFETNTFSAGSSVKATIILRNVTNSILRYSAVGILGRTSPVSVVVTDKSGKPLTPKLEDIAVISLREVKLFPGTEQKFHERIDNLYSLPTNGLINAYAELKIGRPDNLAIQSAKVLIAIQ